MDKYPHARKFLEKTGMTVDEALAYFEEKENNGVVSNGTDRTHR